MKTIGVISDTHIREGGARVLPERVLKLFAGVDLILHGGDINTQSVLDELAAIAPVLAVHGNNDDATIMEIQPTTRRIEVEECVIGLTHGHLPLRGLSVRGAIPRALEYSGNRQTSANALSHFEFDGDVSCVVFGHSHQPLNQWHTLENGLQILLFNPGSPTDKRYRDHFGCGLLRVDGAQLEGELILW